MNIRFLRLGLLAAALLATQHVSATSEAPTINLEDAIKHNNIPAVTAFLDAGGMVDSLVFVNNGRLSEEYLSYTLLHGAASFGTTAMVDLLCDHGANLEARTTDGNTALMLAIHTPDKAITLIDRYVAHDIGVNQHNKFGRTAFILAMGFFNARVAQKLIDADADTKATIPTGGNAIHRAIECNKPDAVRWLLALAPDKRPDLTESPNLVDFACSERKSDIAAILAKAGAPLSAEYIEACADRDAWKRLSSEQRPGICHW